MEGRVLQSFSNDRNKNNGHFSRLLLAQNQPFGDQSHFRRFLTNTIFRLFWPIRIFQNLDQSENFEFLTNHEKFSIFQNLAQHQIFNFFRCFAPGNIVATYSWTLSAKLAGRENIVWRAQHTKVFRETRSATVATNLVSLHAEACRPVVLYASVKNHPPTDSTAFFNAVYPGQLSTRTVLYAIAVRLCAGPVVRESRQGITGYRLTDLRE